MSSGSGGVLNGQVGLLEGWRLQRKGGRELDLLSTYYVPATC